MRKLIQLTIISILAITVTACSGEADAPESNEVSETRMDDVDVIDGTISDDMVDVDNQASGDILAEGEDAEGTAGEEEDSAENSSE